MLLTLLTGLPLRRTSFDLPPLNWWRFGSQARLAELWKIEQKKTFSSDSEELDLKSTRICGSIVSFHFWFLAGFCLTLVPLSVCLFSVYAGASKLQNAMKGFKNTLRNTHFIQRTMVIMV